MSETSKELWSLIARHCNKARQNGGYPEEVRQWVGIDARQRRQAWMQP